MEWRNRHPSRRVRTNFLTARPEELTLLLVVTFAVTDPVGAELLLLRALEE
jgi:hypothetical protein